MQIWLLGTSASERYMEFYRPTASAYAQSNWDLCADMLNSGPDGRVESLNDLVAGEPTSDWEIMGNCCGHHRGGGTGNSVAGSCGTGHRFIWGNTDVAGGYCGNNGGWGRSVLFYIF